PSPHSFFATKSPFYDPSILMLPYDPTKAQALLDALAADGKPLNFTLTAIPTGDYGPMAQYVKSKLEQLKNVKVSINTVATQQIVSAVAARNYQGALYILAADDPHPLWTLAFTCSAAQLGGAGSPTGYCNSKWDQLAADQQSTLDPAQRIADIKEMQKIEYQ